MNLGAGPASRYFLATPAFTLGDCQARGRPFGNRLAVVALPSNRSPDREAGVLAAIAMCWPAPAR